MTLKISSLLALYLYEKKTLSLPGIGIFSLDPGVATPTEGDKRNEDFFQHIQFQQKTISAPDDDLIDFIRKHTGKIQPLAISDLEGFIEDGKVMLNLDKIFHIDGIGNLIKNKQGNLEFSPGNIQSENFYDFIPESTTENIPAKSTEGGSNKNVIIGLALLVGVVAVIVGGYFYYQKNKGEEEIETVNTFQQDIVTDTMNLPVSTDTNINDAQVAVQENKTDAIKGYKFIIETTPRKSRAIRRYDQLKSYFLDIRMDAINDSSLFKLYFVIDAPVKDTSYIKDSLQRWYNASNVVIE